MSGVDNAKQYNLKTTTGNIHGIELNRIVDAESEVGDLALIVDKK